MDKLDSLLPLARMGNDAIFSSVRSSFIDTTLLQVKEFIIRINKVCVLLTSKSLVFVSE